MSSFIKKWLTGVPVNSYDMLLGLDIYWYIPAPGATRLPFPEQVGCYLQYASSCLVAARRCVVIWCLVL